MRKAVPRSQVPDVASQNGVRILAFSLLLAGILGLGFRVYFSPLRLKSWIEAELRRQPHHIDLKFQSAELSLADGPLPQLAIRLTGVEVRTGKSCAAESTRRRLFDGSFPAFQISEVRVPFRVWALLHGQVAVGTVHGDHLLVDLDALQERCAPAAPSDARESGVSLPAAAAGRSVPSLPEPSLPAESETARGGVIKPWWTASQLQTMQNLVSGLAFEQVTISFERGAKSVGLEDFFVRSDVAPQTLQLSTDVRLPPNLFYGQTLPPISIDALLRPDAADVELSGTLNEGTLQGLATLKAAKDDVELDAHLRVTSVPMAAALPYLRTSGWVKADIKPRFLWLNCEASIRGALRRLFKENPLNLEKCVLEGDGGRIAVERAVIGPGIRLEPFSIDVAGLDVHKTLAMFGAEGPRGVMSEFGKLTGRIEVNSPKSISFKGALLGSSLKFSNRNVRVEQRIPRIEADFKWNSDGFYSVISDAHLEGGSYQGKIELALGSDLRDGRIDISLNELGFHSDIERLMMGGDVSQMRVSGNGEIAAGKLATFKGEAELNDLNGVDIRIPKAVLRTRLENDVVRLESRAPAGVVRRESVLLTALKPLFLDHDFAEEWIPWREFNGLLSLDHRALFWEKAAVKFGRGWVQMTSEGQRAESGALAGWVAIEYPKIKKLRWLLSGKGSKPVLTPDEKTSAELRRPEIHRPSAIEPYL